MATKEQVLAELARLELPDGRSLVSADMVRALTVEGGAVRFVIEAPSPEAAAKMEPIRAAAVDMVQALSGVSSASAVLTAHGAQAAAKAPPKLSIGGHPDPKRKDIRPKGVARVIAVG